MQETANDKQYKLTIFSCFVGYVVQAIINNFAPLLFLTFQTAYRIPLSQITLLITVNFGVQLLVDILAAKFVDKIGYRPCIVVAQAFCLLGLVGLTVLPELLPSAYAGLTVSVVLYAIGGGLLEVLVSPIIEGCPSDNKEKTMSLLHSFYCWGHVAVVLLSTLFFRFVGIAHWRYLALIWALFPLADLVLFTRAPIRPPVEEGEKGLSAKSLLKNKLFWVLLFMMICAGASEQAVSQWASAFAEKGLGVSKTLGDLFGPMLFAACMGVARVLYGKFGHKIKLDVFMLWSCLLCVATYLCISLVPNPVVNLVACGICGFSVGILWPGTFSTAAGALKNGGTLMFALLALGGDIGCTAGPTFAGCIASLTGSMKTGILSAVFFPALLVLGIFAVRKMLRAQKTHAINDSENGAKTGDTENVTTANDIAETNDACEKTDIDISDEK